jgi:lipid-binding SYLF domain-containing protein
VAEAAAVSSVGRQHEAANNPTLEADILSYSRSRGLFAGVDVKGVVVKPDDDLNMAVYKKTARDLLGARGSGDVTGSDLQAFPETLGRYTTNPSGSG